MPFVFIVVFMKYWHFAILSKLII